MMFIFGVLIGCMCIIVIAIIALWRMVNKQIHKLEEVRIEILLKQIKLREELKGEK